MKNLLLIGMLTFAFNSQAQDNAESKPAPATEFKVSKERLTDYVVGTVPDKTAAELFKRTLDWVGVTYRNPKEVIKAQIDNDYIRIEGSKENMLCIKSLGMMSCNNVRYQIEISLKDGKYKFDLIRLEQFVPPSQYTAGGWMDVSIDNTSYMYKDNGDLKNPFKLYPEAMESTFNSLNTSLKEYLNGKGATPKKDDW